MRAYAEEGLSIVEVSKEPKNKLYAFMECKYLLIIFLISSLFYFFEEYIPNEDNFYSGIFIGLPLLFYLTYVSLGNTFRKENIKYKIIGKIFFRNDFIEINSFKKNLIEIEKIKIDNYDFKGSLEPSIGGTNPSISLGISNFLTIHFKDGTIEKIQFLQENQYHFTFFHKELMHYHHINLIDSPTIKRLLNSL